MKTAHALLALLAVSTPALAQEEKKPMNGTEVAPVTTVAAGEVHWHASLDEAVAAARKSGKPVLHFQLLGRLDQEFC